MSRAGVFLIAGAALGRRGRRAAFLVRDGAVERWPWNEQGLACV